MAEGLSMERVSSDAVFFIDSRQFENCVFQYDDRIANSLLFYNIEERQEQEIEEHDEQSMSEITA